MAIAPFFDKAALGLAQALRGAGYQALRERLYQTSVGLRISPRAAKSPAGRAIAELVANMLARLYPYVQIEGPDSFTDELWDMMRRINPDIESSMGVPLIDILVGDVPPRSRASIVVAAQRWQCWVGPGVASSIKWDADKNVIGASFAACIAVGSVFRRVFSDLGLDGTIRDRHLSLLTYRTPDRGEANPQWEIARLPTTHLVGIGAVGSAALWLLKRLPLEGQVHLVDGEQVSLSNLQRYVLPEFRHVGWPKVELGRLTPHPAGLLLVPHPETLDSLQSTVNTANAIDHLLIGVDSASARVAAQTLLPRVILNAWTGDDVVGVSTHRNFGGPEPCLACLYRGRRPQQSELARLADTLGLQRQDIIELLTREAGLNPDHIRQIAEHHSVDPADLVDWTGHSIMEFQEKVVCGGVLTRLTGRVDHSEETLVPLVHQSAMAGVVLVAEYLKVVAGLTSTESPNLFVTPVTKPLPELISFRRLRESDARCFCTDPDYVEPWGMKWSCPEYEPVREE